MKRASHHRRRRRAARRGAVARAQHHRPARAQLTAALNASASLDDLSLSLAIRPGGSCAALKIGQPPGSGGDDAGLRRTALRGPRRGRALKGEVRIESVKLEDPRIHVVKDPGRG
ncbi:MAG: hypothetical protein U1F77_17375 [Kiritimatiellia bacterium]